MYTYCYLLRLASLTVPPGTQPQTTFVFVCCRDLQPPCQQRLCHQHKPHVGGGMCLQRYPGAVRPPVRSDPHVQGFHICTKRPACWCLQHCVCTEVFCTGQSGAVEHCRSNSSTLLFWFQHALPTQPAVGCNHGHLCSATSLTCVGPARSVTAVPWHDSCAGMMLSRWLVLPCAARAEVWLVMVLGSVLCELSVKESFRTGTEHACHAACTGP